MNQTPLSAVLHRDTHGQILSSLDCGDAFVSCQSSQGCRGGVRECQVKGKEGGKGSLSLLIRISLFMHN